MIELVLWLINLCILSFLSLPIADKVGFRSLSKLIGLVGITYITWLISFLVEFKLAVLYSFIIFVTMNSLIWISSLKLAKEFKKLILDFFKAEFLFLIFFFIYIIYEMFNPYIIGGEKMSDIAILNGIIKSEGMPPLDLNLAGYRFDCYYYVGYISYAVLTVLSFAPTHISYNLACATVFSLTLSILTSFILQNRDKIVVPFLLLAGNLKTLQMLILGDFNKAFDFWTVTRVIEGTINEFPLATLFFRDLHPHFMSIPLQVAFIISLYNWIKEDRKSTLVFMVFLLGFMFVVNSWDFFTYLFLLTVFALAYKRLYVFVTLPLALIPIFPFHITVSVTAVKGIGFVSQRTDLLSFLMAQPLVIIPFVYAMIEDRKTFFIALLASLPFYFLNFQVLILILPTLSVILKRFVEERSFEHGLILTALITLTAVEIVYLDDPYSGKIERLNTVFKTYVQSWILLSFGFVRPTYKRMYKIFTIIFIAILWIYPLGCAIGLPTLGFKGIDGIEYTKNYGEYDALVFLQKYEGVVVEYPGKTPFESYTYAGRVSAYTGLQSVLCRGGHELFWRYFDNKTAKVLIQRWNDIRKIYEDENLDYSILRKYNVSFIYVGYLERQNYNVSYEKFSKLKKIYDDGNVIVYKVIYPEG